MRSRALRIQAYLRESASAENCKCKAFFKAAESAEFANYIASFQNRKVPVTYDLYDVQGHIGAKLVTVGNWRAEQFHNDDGVIVPVITRVSGKSQIVHSESPGRLFPYIVQRISRREVEMYHRRNSTEHR